MSLVLTANSAFIHQALTSSRQRLDGRSLDAYRPMAVEFLDYGNLFVARGGTRLSIVISTTPEQPRADKPAEGMVFVQCDFPLEKQQQQQSSSSSHQQNHLSRLLETLVRSCTDVESLCILSARLVWTVRVQVRVLGDDGGLYDTAVAGVVMALMHTRRRDVTVVGEDVTIHSMDARHPVPLSMKHTPLAMTFWFVPKDKDLLGKGGVGANDDDDFITLIDPTIEEQHLSTGCLIVAANNQQELVAVVKYGGRASVSAERVLALSRRAVIMFDQQCDHAKHWVVEDLKTRETGKVDLMRGKGKK